MYYAFIFLIFFISTVSGQCPVSQCTCRDHYVDCRGRYFTVMPSFPADISFYSTYNHLDLSNNDLSRISNGDLDHTAFKYIDLHNNNIQTIESAAFHGVSAILQELDLSNNHLQFMPSALSELNTITKLDVSGNPITDGYNFTDSVMKALGDTILEFSFGSRDLISWPTSLSHFPQLQTLTLKGANSRLSVIPPEAFHGFETTILKLNIQDTKVLAVPLGISKLNNLKELHFDNNTLVKDKGILVQSFPTGPASKLEIMSLNGNNLTRFPVVLRYLPSLRNLSIDNNRLNFIDDNSLGELRTIKILSMKNCSLKRVPAALSDLIYLTSLDVSSNNIETIEENDLQDLRFLEHFVVSNNALKYIADTAFGRVPRLKTLHFTNTSMTTVPNAIGKVWPCLENVYMEGTVVDCMCETLVWLRNLRDMCLNDGFPIHVHGKCDTIYSTIEEYVDHYIPQCPQYKEEHNIPPYDHSP